MGSGVFTGLHGIWGASASNLFAVGSNGIILHYDGGTWSETNFGVRYNLNGTWGSSGNYVFAVGSPAAILHYGL